MAANATKPFTLRPWPYGDRKPKNLGEFIQRVSAERNGFRSISTDSLRKEVEAQENGVVEEENGDEMAVDSEPEVDADQVTIEDIHATRAEVAKNAEFAHQNAMLALDFVSLLLSKESPVQAGTTLSPALRELVGIGTLGADKLASTNTSEARLQDNKTVSTGWKFADINKAADDLLTGASRLQKEISLETTYWAEVLAVSNSGWSVTRVPQERHTLGVRYGFSESSLDFRHSSLAPMRRNDDGTVNLDCGRFIGQSQRLRVTITKDGQNIGRSLVPDPLPDKAPLEQRVLESRNNIFAQELWHELNREGRSLLSYNVRLAESVITYEFEKGSSIIFNLQALGEHDPTEFTRLKHADGQAESINAGLHCLLIHAHRENNHRRAKSASVNRNQAATPTYNLLRPIIAYMTHQQAVDTSLRFVSELSAILRLAGFQSAGYILREPPMSPAPAATSTKTSPSEALIHSLLGAPEFQIEFTINPEFRVLIHARTSFFRFITTSYQVHLLPPQLSDDQKDTKPNYLQETFPPTDSPGGYPDLREVLYYLRQATSRVLAEHFQPRMNGWQAEAGEDPEWIDWVTSVSGSELYESEREDRRVRFEVATAGDKWLWDRDEESEEADAAYKSPELRAWAEYRNKTGKQLRVKASWTVAAAKEGATRPSMEDTVKAFAKRDILKR